MHLFDIDIPGKITFKESDILSAGDQISTFEYAGVKIGLGICYDLRFQEMAQIMAKQGKLIFKHCRHLLRSLKMSKVVV